MSPSSIACLACHHCRTTLTTKSLPSPSTTPITTPSTSTNSYGAAIYSGDADESLTDMAVDLAGSVAYVSGTLM